MRRRVPTHVHKVLQVLNHHAVARTSHIHVLSQRGPQGTAAHGVWCRGTSKQGPPKDIRGEHGCGRQRFPTAATPAANTPAASTSTSASASATKHAAGATRTAKITTLCPTTIHPRPTLASVPVPVLPNPIHAREQEEEDTVWVQVAGARGQGGAPRSGALQGHGPSWLADEHTQDLGLALGTRHPLHQGLGELEHQVRGYALCIRRVQVPRAQGLSVGVRRYRLWVHAL